MIRKIFNEVISLAIPHKAEAIVNVALQTISRELQVPASAMGTVNVGYLVSLAVFLPISGWLGDR
ncbi:hypothetical protein ACT4UM_18115 [Bacillus sp. SS-TM]